MQHEIISIYQMHKRLCNCNGLSTLKLDIKGAGDSGQTFIDFCDYYERHYKPLLQQLAKDRPDTAARFIVDDMDSIFLGYMKEWEQD